jgi:hypothetical protein
MWNKFVYVVNNPLRFSDRDGLRPQTAQETHDLNELRNYANALLKDDPDTAKKILEAVKGIEAAIAASRDQTTDPRGLRISLWAINRFAEPDTSRFGLQGTASFTKNGIKITIGPGQKEWKCNLFVAAAQTLSGGVQLGGDGIPITGRIWGMGSLIGSYNIPSANTWASMDPNAIPSYELMASPQQGDVVGWAAGTGSGHSAVSIGGDAVIYASTDGLKVNSIQRVSTAQNADAVFRRKKE